MAFFLFIEMSSFVCLLLSTFLLFVSCQTNVTTTTTTTTTTTLLAVSNATTTMTTNSASPAAATTAAACQVVSFDLHNANSSEASRVLTGDCQANLTATFRPVGGSQLVCSALRGCGVEAKKKKKRASELNGDAEGVEVLFNAPVLLWQVEFGEWNAGIDSVTLEMTALLQNNATVNFTSSSPRWSALTSVVESGVEPPVVRRVVVRSNNLSGFSLLVVRAKPYVAPPSMLFTTAPTLPPTTTAPTAATTTDFAIQLKYWMENEAIYFWLVIAAIILCLLICIGGIIIYCCCLRGDDDDGETYSMRDASAAYRDDDWL